MLRARRWGWGGRLLGATALLLLVMTSGWLARWDGIGAGGTPSIGAVGVVAVYVDAGLQTVVDWAEPDAGGGAGAPYSYTVSEITNLMLFAADPAVAADGTLTYTPAPGAVGTSLFNLVVRDSGGTDSAPRSFEVAVEEPFVSAATEAIPAAGRLDATIEVSGLTTAIARVSLETGIRHSQPSSLAVTLISPEGTRVFLANGAGGHADAFFGTFWDQGARNWLGDWSTFFSRLVPETPLRPQDEAGGLSKLRGEDPNGTWTLVIHTLSYAGTLEGWIIGIAPTLPVGDPPTFDQVPVDPAAINEDGVSAPVDFSVADLNEPDEDLSVTATSSDPALVPTGNIVISSLDPAGDGTVTVTPAMDAVGTATITLRLQPDSDGNLGPTTSFDVTVDAVNDAPSVGATGVVMVFENAGPQAWMDWAAAVPGGGQDEALQTFVYAVSNVSDLGLFELGQGPALDAAGTLTYTPATDTVGMSTSDVVVTDNGGTPNGGSDTSMPQTFSIIVAKAFESTEVPIVIDQDSHVDFESTLEVSGVTNLIQRVLLYTDIPHSFFSFMDIYLISPGGTTVQLEDWNHGRGTNAHANVYWDDVATPTSVTLTGARVYAPRTPLAALNGEDPNGVWTLRINNYAPAGELTNWSLGLAPPTGAAPTFDLAPAEPVPINEDSGAFLPIAFRVADAEDAPGDLVVSATTSDPMLVPVGNIVFSALEPNGDGTVTVTPAPEESGTATITLRVTDADDNFRLASFHVTVNAVNDAPVAMNDTFTMDAGETLTGNVLGNNGAGADMDLENGAGVDAGTVTLLGNPPAGHVRGFTLDGDGSFTYIHEGVNQTVHTVTFDYVLSDNEPGDAKTSQATVTIEVTPDDHSDVEEGATVVGVPSNTPGDVEISYDNDVFQFSATAGEALHLYTILDTLGDSAMEIWDSGGGLPVLSNDDTSFENGSEILFVPPWTGTFLVAVWGEGGDIGTYELVIARPLAVGRTVTAGEISPLGEADAFRFETDGVGEVVVRTVLDTLGDSTLELYNSNGVLCTANDDDVGYESRIDAGVLDAGFYYTVVRGYNSSNEGTYELHVTMDGGPPVLPPPPPPPPAGGAPPAVASVALATDPAPLAETNVDGGQLILTLTASSWADPLSADLFAFEELPGVEVSTVVRVSGLEAQLTLARVEPGVLIADVAATLTVLDAAHSNAKTFDPLTVPIVDDDPDSDDDGLTDEEEVNLWHTDPLKSDTDNDGIRDGDEVISQTDPLDPVSGPPLPVVPDLIFADGFESGDTSAWTSTAPQGTSGNVFHGIAAPNVSALRVSDLADGPLGIDEAVSFMEGEITAIFGWDAVLQQFTVWRPGVPAFLNTLTELAPGQAIFILSDDPAGVVWSQGAAIVEERELALRAGFNLVGWAGPDGFTVGALQALLGDALVSVFMLDPTTGSFASFISGAPDFVNNLTALPYSRGIWVQVDRDVAVLMPARDGSLAPPAIPAGV